MFAKDPYSPADSAGRLTHNSRPLAYNNAQQGYHPDQPYRDYDHPPSHYDVSGGGYQEPKYRNYDSNLPYENSVPQYDQQPWNQPHPAATASSQSLDQRSPFNDGHHDPHYTPPLRYDEPPPPTTHQFDGRPRYGKPTGAAPMRYDEPPLPAPASNLHSDQDLHLNAYPLPPSPSAARSPEPTAQRSAFGQGPAPPQKTHKPQQYDPAGTTNSDGSPTPPLPPPKAQTSSSPSPVEAPQDDSRPQSVLTRVKMFENKRSVSVDRARDAGDFPGNKVSGMLPTPLLFC